MRLYLTCELPKRFVRVAWISLQPNGSISFGLTDKTFISPIFRSRILLWNAYNRVTASYLIESNSSTLEGVKNPHFTYHPPIQFHLKDNKSKKKKDKALFEGLCDVPIALNQQQEIPWIRAITRPVSEMRSAGLRWTNTPTNDLAFRLQNENTSLKIGIDFVQPELVGEYDDKLDGLNSDNKKISTSKTWAFRHHSVGLRIGAEISEPQISTLSWFHSY